MFGMFPGFLLMSVESSLGTCSVLPASACGIDVEFRTACVPCAFQELAICTASRVEGALLSGSEPISSSGCRKSCDDGDDFDLHYDDLLEMSDSISIISMKLT